MKKIEKAVTLKLYGYLFLFLAALQTVMVIINFALGTYSKESIIQLAGNGLEVTNTLYYVIIAISMGFIVLSVLIDVVLGLNALKASKGEKTKTSLAVVMLVLNIISLLSTIKSGISISLIETIITVIILIDYIRIVKKVNSK